MNKREWRFPDGYYCSWCKKYGKTPESAKDPCPVCGR